MTNRENTVLVTGGAGFIGSELVSQLFTAGRRVIILDNLANGSLKNFAALEADRVEFVQGDVRDAALLANPRFVPVPRTVLMLETSIVKSPKGSEL